MIKIRLANTMPVETPDDIKLNRRILWRTQMNGPEIVRLKNSISERDHALGSEYGNFECPHCGQAYPVFKELRKLLSENLRFVFRHFPTVQTHPHALRAAEAAEAANAQGKFWKMHDELFTHQQALEDRDLSRYARRIGLDVIQFETDMSQNTFLKQVEADYQLALFDEHITGTPTLYINSLRYTGATDVDVLLQAIKEADTEGRIELPQRAKGFRRFLGKLPRGEKG
jgi:formate-nitrite transporter family protein